LKENCFRSSVSRAYYAMFAATTANLIETGETPRADMGTWTHLKLQEVARATWRRTNRRGARDLTSLLLQGYASRCDADYCPGRSIDKEPARVAVSNTYAALRNFGVLE
ncbi:MAG: hypothetical protein AB7N71_15205, partial [Phycisphaerae bacterium]